MPTTGTVRSITRDWASLVRLSDPDRLRQERRTIEYEFGSGKSKRVFRADPSKRGAYAPEES
jgi:hypothetical protein